MSKVVRFHELGGPEVLKLEDETPQAPGPGEAQVEVRAIGLNRAEAMFRRGEYMEQPSLPSRIGYEVSGVIRAVGPDVTAFKAGDAVSTIPGYSQSRYGGYAQVAVVPADVVRTTAPRAWPPVHRYLEGNEQIGKIIVTV